MYERLLNLPTLLKKKSFFLFGPRSTGKSFLIRQQFNLNEIHFIDLLDSRVYNLLATQPAEIESLLNVSPDKKIVVIDEVQLIPSLLNEVHRLIETQSYRFLLTGSSARRLRAKGVNLLAGRAWEANLFPLTMMEIPDFNLNQYLHYGGLPAIYASTDPKEELQAYVKTYLTEEIQAEAFVRKVPAFSKFMRVAALTSGSMLNFSSLSNDTGVSATTIREYYQILEDTFIGFMVPAWQKTIKRKPISTAKFYFFDVGIKNTIADIITTLPKQSDLYGQAFEHFLAMELRAFINYHRLHINLYYWRSTHGDEVDFILGDHIAIEVKTTNRVTNKHLKNLKRLKEEALCQHYILVSHDKISRCTDGILMIHWQDFLRQLYSGKFFT